MKNKKEIQPPMPDDDSRLGNISWGADYLGTSEQHMRALLRSNIGIPHLRLGGKIRFSKPEFRKFFQEKAVSRDLKDSFRSPIHRKKVRKARKPNTATNRGTQQVQAAVAQ